MQYVANIPEDIQRLIETGVIKMSEAPLSFQLPNGLELTMFPKDHAKSGLATLMNRGKADAVRPETRGELWARFVQAIETTDFKALASFYKSAMPKNEPHILPKTSIVPPPSNPVKA